MLVRPPGDAAVLAAVRDRNGSVRRDSRSSSGRRVGTGYETLTHVPIHTVFVRALEWDGASRDR